MSILANQNALMVMSMRSMLSDLSYTLFIICMTEFQKCGKQSELKLNVRSLHRNCWCLGKAVEFFSRDLIVKSFGLTVTCIEP